MLLAQRKDFWQLLDRTHFSPPPDHVNVIGRFDLIQETMLLKTLRSSFENLRTNGGGAEMVGEFPFMLSLVEAFLGFFSRIRNKA